jgi:basic membrane lipoprotein Med (substrate-binding protein (PBP1-ABC) superfamily)
MKEGIVDFIWNPQLTSRVPLDLKARIDATKQKIADGTFVVPKESG